MAHANQDVATIQPALDKINEAWKNASEEMYKQGDAQGAPQDAQPADQGDNVQDVDYEEVK